MNNRFTYRGTLHEVLAEKTFAKGFKKRDFVCETKNDKYTDFAVFTAKKEMADKIALVQPGAELEVEFVLDGHNWQDPKGELRWFGNATALRIEIASGVNAGSLNAEERADREKQEQTASAADEDYPF